MKAMTRQQLAAYAGVDARTLRNWIKPYQEQLWRMGMPKGKGALPPNVACDVPMGAHPAVLAACVANKKRQDSCPAFLFCTIFIFQLPRVRRSRGRRASWDLLRDLHDVDDR